ncbi:hypothetical protein [Luteolibacter sp. Populi]|uniref:hypothetical protein n=1 Tax=Luteolibacter sp. Populi TaxID=3230487 RepID=UPI003466D5F4
MPASDPILTKERILAALDELNAILQAKGVTGELCIFGGAAMVLAFDARESTRDVDAIFVPKAEVVDASRQVAEHRGLPESWLNDGVKGFVSPSGELTMDGMPQWENLRILRPGTPYLLAMKCLASRVAGYDGAGDRDDILRLCRELGLRESAAVLDIVATYYPESMIPAKTRFFVEEILASADEGGAP